MTDSPILLASKAAASARGTRLAWPLVWGYGAGGIGVGISAAVPSILLLYFMTQVLSLPLGLASLVVLAPKAVVIALDPAIGRWSDRTRSRWGRRRPFMLAGALLASAAFAVLFSVPKLGSVPLTFAAVLAAYLAASVTYSLFGVAYTAVPPELTRDPAERVRVVGARVGLVFAGMLLGAAGAPILVERFGGGAEGHRLMALTVAPVVAAVMLIPVFALNRAVAGPVGERGTATARMELAAIARFWPFTVAMGINLLCATGVSAFMSTTPYFVTIGLGRPVRDVAAIILAQLACSFLSMGVWTRLLPRMRFATVLILALATAIAGGGVLSLGAHGLGGWIAVVAGSAMFGFGAGGLQVTGLAVLAETVERFSRATGQRREGLMTGLWTAVERIALALGPAVTSVALALGGFTPGVDRAQLPSAALEAARLSVAAGPALLFLAAACAAALAAPYRSLGAESATAQPPMPSR